MAVVGNFRERTGLDRWQMRVPSVRAAGDFLCQRGADRWVSTSQPMVPTAFMIDRDA